MSKNRGTVTFVTDSGDGLGPIRDLLEGPFAKRTVRSAYGALETASDGSDSDVLVFEPAAAQDLRDLHAAAIAAQFEIARLAESRDEDTGRHLERTREYCRLLAVEVENAGVELDRGFADTIYNASPLHDIGKIAIPDGVLCKPGKLTDHEFEVMKSHTVRGAETLQQVVNQFPKNPFLTMVHDIVRSHHEKWDGTGYPDGLSGDAIPLSARIMAIADVYDALTSKRPYKEPFPHDRSREIIREGAGTHFDPALVQAFLAIEDQIERVRDTLGDDDATHETRRWERAPQ